MWEGEATSRRSQQLAGVALALVSLPFALVGIWGLWRSIFKPGTSMAVIATVTGVLLVGLFGLTIAYRIFFGRGVRRGGGVMSPLAFRVGGFGAFALAAYFSYEIFANGNYGFLAGAGVVSALDFSFICFVAARHRGAMRPIE